VKGEAHIGIVIKYLGLLFNLTLDANRVFDGSLGIVQKSNICDKLPNYHISMFKNLSNVRLFTKYIACVSINWEKCLFRNHDTIQIFN